MAPGLVRAALAAAAVVASIDARAEPLAVRIYPLTGADPATVADAQSLLRSGLVSAARRGERLAVGKPDLLAASCGRPPGLACLTQLAQGGLVLTGAVEQQGATVVASLRAVDASGKAYAFQVSFDAFLQSSEPFARALVDLEARLPVGSAGAPVARPAPSAPRDVPLPPPPRAAAPKSAAAAPAAPAARPPAADLSARPAPAPAPAPERLAYREPEPVKGAWLRPAGIWTTAAGVALLAAGGTVAYLNQQEAKSLEKRFKSNALTRGDASRYQRVDTYNTLTTALLAAGGAAAATGVVLWASAPGDDSHAGGGAGYRGRF